MAIKEKFILSMQEKSVQALENISNSPNARSSCCSQWRYEKDAFISEMRASYQHKFAKKPEVIDGIYAGTLN